MREVYKGLWVGPEEDVPKAREKGMSIIHACKEGPYSHRSVLDYKSLGAPKGSEYLVARRGKEVYINLVDSDDPNFIPDDAVNAALVFIKENLDKNQSVFIHCNEGKSRAPSLAFLYLYSIGKLPREFHNALRTFRTLYPDYDPAIGMQLYSKKRIRELKR